MASPTRVRGQDESVFAKYVRNPAAFKGFPTTLSKFEDIVASEDQMQQ